MKDFTVGEQARNLYGYFWPIKNSMDNLIIETLELDFVAGAVRRTLISSQKNKLYMLNNMLRTPDTRGTILNLNN